MTLRIAIIGFGKIARDQHAAALAADRDYEIVAAVSGHGAGPAGVPVFPTVDALFASGIAIDACTHCNTPGQRFDTAWATIAAGKHTMLEKPPFASLAQCAAIEAAAASRGVSLMTTWHSQANAAVDRARDWLADKRIAHVRVDWREDVRKWHPGQDWIWEAGGFGVFDPGINGLSVLTRMLPFAPYVDGAVLIVPANRAMPIAADIRLAAPGFDGAIDAHFDWRETAGECWQIAVETDQGALLLADGGRRLSIGGQQVLAHGDAEYPTLYARFAALVRAGESDVHLDPLRIVADAFLLGRREQTAPFDH